MIKKRFNKLIAKRNPPGDKRIKILSNNRWNVSRINSRTKRNAKPLSLNNFHSIFFANYAKEKREKQNHSQFRFDGINNIVTLYRIGLIIILTSLKYNKKDVGKKCNKEIKIKKYKKLYFLLKKETIPTKNSRKNYTKKKILRVLVKDIF